MSEKELMSILEVGKLAYITASRVEGCAGLGTYYAYLHLYWLGRGNEKPPLKPSIICMN